MTSTTNLTLNLSLPNIAQIAYAVQGDQLSRELTIQLVDGSVPWEPPAGALATVRYRKPDGTTGFYDTMEDGTTPAVTVSGSTVTLILANQALTVPGVVLMQLNFYETDESRVTTFAWSLIVQPSVLTDAAFISTDYYNILTQQIAAVLEAAAALAGLTATATGLPTGSDPTVTVTGGSGGAPYNLAFAIPAGPVGPPEIPTTATTYQEGSSATTPPTGTWQDNPPTVAQGNYLWTRTVLTYSSGTTATFYSVARQGMDGQGAPGSQTPLPDSPGGVVGTAAAYSREDHRHPYPGTTLEAAVHSISANGTTSYTLTGLTADFVICNWGLFSDAACTTPIPENAPPCDITITTAADSWSVTIANYSTVFYLRPTFILKQN